MAALRAWCRTCCGNWAAFEPGGPTPAGCGSAPAARPQQMGTTTNLQAVGGVCKPNVYGKKFIAIFI